MSEPRRPPFEGAVTHSGALRRWWERNFFKHRLVLGLDQESDRSQPQPTLDGYRLIGVAGGEGHELAPEHAAALAPMIPAATLAARLARPDITLFLAARASDGELGGYVWAVTPLERAVWHDRVAIHPGSALLFNGYVFPAHRRHGVFTALMAALQDHCLDVLGCPLVLGVVEASNLASLRTLRSLGYRLLGDNYIVKLLGVSLLSLVTWRSGRPRELSFVYRNARGRNL